MPPQRSCVFKEDAVLSVTDRPGEQGGQVAPGSMEAVGRDGTKHGTKQLDYLVAGGGQCRALYHTVPGPEPWQLAFLQSFLPACCLLFCTSRSQCIVAEYPSHATLLRK